MVGAMMDNVHWRFNFMGIISFPVWVFNLAGEMLCQLTTTDCGCTFQNNLSMPSQWISKICYLTNFPPKTFKNPSG
jgi:hypothetical protein